MSKLRYFAYGSNMHPRRLQSRTPSAKVLSVETSSFSRLHFNKAGLDNSGKCNIVASGSEHDLVHGVVYELSIDEKHLLDQAERGYRQCRIGIGAYENVLVYIAEENSLACTRPYSWYRDIVIAGARYHDFPESYIEHISSFRTIPDPDREREHRHRSIVWPDR